MLTSGALERPLSESADPGVARQVVAFVYKTYVVAEIEIRKLRHDPTELITRAIQPALWLLIFGEVFANAPAIPTGGVPYLDFMAPGILAQSVLFVAIFSGLALIWERDLGIIHKLFVSPTPRAALVLGKAAAAGARSLSQVVIVVTLAVLLGVRLRWHPLALAGVVLAVLVGASAFATLSLIIASLVKTRERFMGIGQVLTMPLFFASNAIYPLSIMPRWLHVTARLNPLTYEVDALRALMMPRGVSAFGLATDFGVLVLTATVLVVIASRVYPRVVA
jgi:ABC-2 type transport system permease protein